MDRIQPYWTGLMHWRWEILPILERVADWAERLDWDSFGPPVCAGGAIVLFAVLVLWSLNGSDKRQLEFWSAFALAGRWVALGAAVTPVVVWAAALRGMSQ
jgi:hypothetical protein